MKKVKAHLILVIILVILTSQVVHAEPNREIARLGRGIATGLAWRPDGKVLAVGSSNGVWFFNDNMEQIQQADVGLIRSLEWNPNGKTLLIKRANDRAEIWAVNDSLSLIKRSILPIEGQSFIWSPDGKWIAVSDGSFQNGNYSGAIQIVDVQTG